MNNKVSAALEIPVAALKDILGVLKDEYEDIIKDLKVKRYYAIEHNVGDIDEIRHAAYTTMSCQKSVEILMDMLQGMDDTEKLYYVPNVAYNVFWREMGAVRDIWDFVEQVMLKQSIPLEHICTKAETPKHGYKSVYNYTTDRWEVTTDEEVPTDAVVFTNCAEGIYKRTRIMYSGVKIYTEECFDEFLAMMQNHTTFVSYDFTPYTKEYAEEGVKDKNARRDRMVRCSSCGKDFLISGPRVRWCKENNIPIDQMCAECTMKNKANKTNKKNKHNGGKHND